MTYWTNLGQGTFENVEQGSMHDDSQANTERAMRQAYVYEEQNAYLYE